MAHLDTTQLFLFFIIYFNLYTITNAAPLLELTKSFIAKPNPNSPSLFQSLLQDPTGNFSLGFLRVDSSQLALAVVHLPSTQQIWIANPTNLAPWSDKTQFLFNGSLVILNSHTNNVFWSTGSNVNGDKLVLLNNSNLQLLESDRIVWESFGFPRNTLVENQNFTSAMEIVNGVYSMKLGLDFFGLYATFDGNRDQIYYKHTALQVKAQIVRDGKPIYARVNSDGFLGMYQNSDVTPVDIEAFNSYRQTVTPLRLLRLESDGNLKAYYWDTSSSTWALDYQPIRDTCQLPSPCGPYGLCKSGSGCSCLNNRTETKSGLCHVSNNLNPGSDSEFCDKYKALRRVGVELPFKELMRYESTSSMASCEGICEKNCSCYGAVYNNGSGFCYIVDYPIQTIVGISDVSKMGYFKIREVTQKKKMDVMIGILCGVIVTLILGVAYCTVRIWRRKKRDVRGVLVEENGMSPGPYTDLGSASFKSIELSNR